MSVWQGHGDRTPGWLKIKERGGKENTAGYLGAVFYFKGLGADFYILIHSYLQVVEKGGNMDGDKAVYQR